MPTPPINSQRVPPCSARESRSDSVHHWSDRDNTFACHGAVNPKLSDELREYLVNQPRLVLIGVNGVARPFFHLPFHNQEIARG